MTFLLICSKHFEFNRPRLIKLAKIWKPLFVLPLRLRVGQGRCCDLKKKTDVRMDVQIFGN